MPILIFSPFAAWKSHLTFSLSAQARFGSLSAATNARGMPGHPAIAAEAIATMTPLALSWKA
jgi:hypothetical protein